MVLWRRRWRRERPSVGESAVVGLGVTGVEAEFPIGVDAHSFDDEQ